jgi:hypothetical protein
MFAHRRQRDPAAAHLIDDHVLVVRVGQVRAGTTFDFPGRKVYASVSD